MNKVVAPLVATLVLGAAPASADTAEQANERPARSLSLAEALQVTVRQSPDLERASIDISVAEANLLQSMGIDDWVLTGTGAWSSRRNNPVEGQTFVTTAEDTYALAVGVGRSLRSGGTISIDASGSWGSTTSFLEITDETGNTFETEQTSKGRTVAVSATFTHSLLRGFGSDIARAGQEQARISKDLTTLQNENVALATVRAVIDAYWELAYAQEEVTIRRGSLELADEQLRITRAGIEAGATAPTASLPLEQGILVREEAILVAEVTVSNLSLVVRRLVGMEVGPGEIDIHATEPLALEERDFNVDDAIARALERNPSIAIIEQTGKGQDVVVRVAKDAMRPSLEFSASAGPIGNASKTSDAFDRLVKFDTFSLSASLVYTQRLGNRGAEGAYQAALDGARSIDVSLAEAQRVIAADVTAAINEVRAAKRRIEVSAKSIELAEQNLVNEKASFDAGNSTNFDILRRQEEIEQAKLTHSRAVVDYRKAVVKVDVLTGDLLERNGIKIEAE